MKQKTAEELRKLSETEAAVGQFACYIFKNN